MLGGPVGVEGTSLSEVYPVMSDDLKEAHVDDRVVRRVRRLAASDPLESLSPTARRIVEAAQDLLLSKGVSGLTVDAVTKKAGINRAAVSYHFGGKAGLVTAVIDATVHDTYVELANTTKDLPLGAERIDAFVTGKVQIASSDDTYRVLFSALAVALADTTLRRRLSRAYDWYRKTNLAYLGAETALPREEVAWLAQVVTAVVDGLAIQRAVSAQSLDVEPALRLFGRMLSTFLSAYGETCSTEEKNGTARAAVRVES